MKQHLSSEEISAWLAGEPAENAARHLRECLACRAEVEGLRDTLAQFRESGTRWSAHYMMTAPTPRRKPAALATVVAFASMLAVAAVLLRQAAPVAEERPFVAIPYVVPLAPYERASVMRMDVPVAALVAAGFEVHGAEPGGTVSADVLVGQDGRMHAVRLISNGSVIQ